MFLNAWSLALSLLSVLSLLLMCLSSWTAVRVLRYWDPASDANRQITLESETWLVSTLVEYSLGFQILSLVLFVFAADHYAHLIVGAMCATGALLANGFGFWALLFKMLGVFLYGYWIVMHRIDIASEHYPLIRLKYIYLLVLLPYMVCDALLQSLYIAGLHPDIITSCCGVVFGEAGGQASQNVFAGLSRSTTLAIFYLLAFTILVLGVLLLWSKRMKLVFFYAAAWLFFFIVAIAAITLVFSSYIYAMPFHKCPFCILKPEYHYIGVFLYGFLLAGAFAGMAPAMTAAFARREDLRDEVRRLQLLWVKSSLVLLGLFSVLSAYHYGMYCIMGGEN